MQTAMLYKYTYIVYNQLSITVETCLFNILLPSCITCTTTRLKLLSGTLPKHEQRQDAHSVLVMHVFTKYFYN